jgi:hypothetical protein
MELANRLVSIAPSARLAVADLRTVNREMSGAVGQITRTATSTHQDSETTRLKPDNFLRSNLSLSCGRRATAPGSGENASKIRVNIVAAKNRK